MPSTNGPPPAPPRLQPGERAVVGGQHVAELGRGALAVGRQLDAAAAAGEQRLAELVLEPADVAADRGLGEVQRLGGAVVAAEADDREEGAQVGGVEVHAAMVARRGDRARDRSPMRIGRRRGAIGRAPRARAPLDACPTASSCRSSSLLWSSGYVVGARRHRRRRPAPAARRAVRARLARRRPAGAARRALARRAARAARGRRRCCCRSSSSAASTAAWRSASRRRCRRS